MNYMLAIATVAFTATPALAEDWDFMLTNQSGKPIKAIELAPAGTVDWKPQTVDAETKRESVVKTGARTTVRFDKPENQCRYDLKTTFEDGTSLVWSGANICANSYVTLKLAGGKPIIAAN
jgi:hypothetical protein